MKVTFKTMAEGKEVMKMTKYVVTYVESGDRCDGRARVLGIFNTKEEANTALIVDIDTYSHTNEVDADYDDWRAGDDELGCLWNINEVEM